VAIVWCPGVVKRKLDSVLSAQVLPAFIILALRLLMQIKSFAKLMNRFAAFSVLAPALSAFVLLALGLVNKVIDICSDITSDVYTYIQRLYKYKKTKPSIFISFAFAF
jgi:hypothetical protein